MAQEKSIGSAVPRGVVDTKSGTVGVPNQKTMEEEVRWLRDQVNALKETLADLGIPSGRAVANTVKDTVARPEKWHESIPPGRPWHWSVSSA